MRTNVYIDGFNLYYGAVKDTKFKWLNTTARSSVGPKGRLEVSRGRKPPDRRELQQKPQRGDRGFYPWGNFCRPVGAA